MIRELLCTLGYHDEFEDRWTEYRSENGDAIGRMQVKVIKREFECVYCSKRSTQKERDKRELTHRYVELGVVVAALLLTLFLVATSL